MYSVHVPYIQLIQNAERYVAWYVAKRSIYLAYTKTHECRVQSTLHAATLKFPLT